MSGDLVAHSEKREYGELFRFDLNWGAPDHSPITVELENGETLTATNVSSYHGLRVWECPSIPGSALEARLEQLISKTSTNRLLIFHDEEKQVWRWPSRSTKGAGVTSRPARHVHRTGSADPKFAARLEAIKLPEDVVLDVNAVLTKVRDAFDVETKNETRRASKLMATLYAAIEKRYPGRFDPKLRDHEISVTLARVLFLLFGDDTEMWTDARGNPMPDLFQDFVKDHTARDGSDIGERINALFKTLDTAPSERGSLPSDLAAFPYVNGGIFEEPIELPSLGKDFRDALLTAAAVDWSTISPAIFGSMFQSVRDAQTRRELGEHYTSEENILKTLKPLFLNELRQELSDALARDTPKKKANALHRLWDKLGNLRYMDPACGCGNFIIVAYRELRALELDLMLALQDISGYSQLAFDPTLELKVTLDHFYGIEIDEWPARIAETAMFLIDRQCDLRLKERFGEAPQRLPIQREAHIVVGNALRLDWTQICPPSEDVVIAGNPPFLGHATRSPEQAQELRDVWGKEDISRLDYVTGWHAKALNFFGDRRGHWAFVTTNSIVQGDPVPHLFRPILEATWKIKFAHRTFPWTSEAAGKAAVHCVIIGFTRSSTPRPRLFDHREGVEAVEGREVRTINAYLVDGPNVLIEKRSKPLSMELSETTFGNMPRDDGNLIVEPADYAEVAEDPVAAKYLRPFRGSTEVLNNKQRWCLWLTELDPRDAKQSRILADRIDRVRDFRLKSSASSTRQMADTPHLFGQRPALHDRPYIVIPRVASDNRPYFAVQLVEPEVIASDATFTAPDPDGFLFAIISSAMFITWQRTVGGRLKSDLRFSSTIVWNNLPLPRVDPVLREDIIRAGERVRDARALYPQRSLAQLYAPGAMVAELAEAHAQLDALVDRAFGASETCTTELERQAILFEKYQELTSGEELPL